MAYLYLAIALIAEVAATSALKAFELKQQSAPRRRNGAGRGYAGVNSSARLTARLFSHSATTLFLTGFSPRLIARS
jgi:hypothetical protein